MLALAAVAAVLPAGVAQAAPERYIVVLNDSAGDPAAVAADHGRSYQAQADHVFRTALRGYSAVIPSERVAALRSDKRVAYVEADGVVTASAQTVPYGIDKVDADVASVQAGNGSGAVTGVTAYVIDSGIAAHADLNLLNPKNVNYAGGKATDCNGHGTHVAGTIAAKDDANFVVGVAPGAALVGVKVLGCNGSGTTSGVIAGVDWVAANAAPGTSVANMSLGGGVSTALDDAVRRLGTKIPVALAAGNETALACGSSPARTGAGTANGIITTGATDSLDREASFSNYGSCVDLWAPGVDVLSTSRSGGTVTYSGTSMASPHMAGGAALVLARTPGTAPAAVESALVGSATTTGTASRDGRAITRLNVAGF